jgi:hypothetical protein
MINTTYNPVLEVSEISWLRLATPIRSPRIGTALVLERTTGERVVVASGERVPERHLGRYHRSYLVDLGRYGVKLHEQLPSRDPSFPFLATITFACQVLDPVAVVASGITDMTAAVRASLTRTMRTVAARHDVLSVANAEAALNSALDRFTGNDVIGLDSFVVELDTGHTSAIHEVRRTARLDGMRREEMAEVVRGGRDALIAQMLAKNDGDPSALMEHEAEMKTRENAHYLEALRIITASGETMEGFDARKHRTDILGRFLGPGGEEPRESGKRLSRRSRVVGSLVPKAGETTPPDAADPTPPDDGARRSSRVRGTAPGEPPRQDGA